jgi:hypothetical protein
MATKLIRIIYCSWSSFKKEEWQIAKARLELDSQPGKKLGELFELEFRQVPTTEPLLCDLEAMVKFKIESDRVPWRGVAECGSPRSPAWAGSVSRRLPGS